MQSSKPIISRNTRSKPLKIWRLSKEGAVILIFATMLISLVSTSYIVGQFEIKQSTLILNRDGCIHLDQVGINSQRLPDSDTCRVELPFRPNPLDAGGRIWAGERVIKIPESQLICFSPRNTRRRTQVVKGEVCKTSMQRFESARRLQFFLEIVSESQSSAW